MFGFLIGTACLIGLIKTVCHGRHGGCGGCGSGFHRWGGGCGGSDRRDGGCGERGEHGEHGGCHHGEHGWRGFGGPGMFLRAMFRKLDTTPGQEKVIREAFEEVFEAGRKARGEAKASREDVAKAVRSEGFDEVLFGEMFARHDSSIEALRKAVVGALAKVHGVLDERQRGRLAEMIERGPGFFRGHFQDHFHGA